MCCFSLFLYSLNSIFLVRQNTQSQDISLGSGKYFLTSYGQNNYIINAKASILYKTLSVSCRTSIFRAFLKTYLRKPETSCQILNSTCSSSTLSLSCGICFSFPPPFPFSGTLSFLDFLSLSGEC